MATPTPTTGASTPMVQLDPEETAKSLRVSLADLSAKAAALYAHKHYEEASEVYAQAAEMQAEMNGEMNPENAEILFLYGRALFKVGQSKSDVLGGKAAEAKKTTKPKSTKVATSANGSAPATAEKKEDGAVEVTGSSAAAIAEAEHKLDEMVDEAAAKEAAQKEKDESLPEQQKKPLFQFEGDDNLVDSDEEDEAGEGEGEDEEEDDDLATAFEILDLACVLFNKRLEALQAEDEAQQGKGKEAAEAGSNSAIIRHIKERLADTHDLLAEISLENERYPNAITDSRASLKYKEELYPFESEIIAEAHFKLSLALEFASVTKSSDDDNNETSKDTVTTNSGADQVDQALRDEAASALEAAINSTKQKLQNKEVELATLHNPDDNEATRRQIADVKEVLADMEQRLVDLRKPPVDIKSALGIPPTSAADAPQPEVSEEVKKNATDLTGLVRKKRKADEGPAAGAGGVEGELAEKKVREGDAGAN